MEMNKITPDERTVRRSRIAKTTKIGSYTFAISAVLLAVIIIINSMIGLLPSHLTVFDTSANKLYTISDSTEKYLSSLSEDVTLHWICQGGEQDATLLNFLNTYVSKSSHLSLNVIDPIKDPTALDKYVSDTATSAPSNLSLIVESARRYMIVDFFDLFYFYNQFLEENAGIGIVPYEMYEMYESYYGVFSTAESYGSVTEELFYGDDTLTKAIEYVTLENIPHMYVLDGHGEDLLSPTFTTFASTAGNLTLDTLRLDTVSEVPADANCVIIFSPTEDLSANDTKLLRSYLRDGGNMLLITDRTNTEHTNLLSLMEDYGMTAESGIVYEGSASGYKDTPNYIIPTADQSHEAVAYAAGYAIHIPNAHAITIAEGATAVTPLLTTTASAYTLNGDIKSDTGTRVLGAAAEVATDSSTSKIVWYSSSEAFTDSVATAASYGNYYYLIYSMLWMNETYESGLTTVKGPSLSEPLLTGLTASSILTWAIIFVFIIPGIILTVGLVVWIRRKKR